MIPFKVIDGVGCSLGGILLWAIDALPAIRNGLSMVYMCDDLRDEMVIIDGL